MVRTAAPALLTAALAIAAPAAELTLSDGRTMAGELVSRTADEIRLRVPLGTSLGEIGIPAERVVAVSASGGAQAMAQIAAIRAVELRAEQADADELATLREQARGAGLGALVRRCHELLVRLDRHREDSARAAGLVRHRGVWMRPAELAAARGEVAFDGRWVSWAERDAALAERARREAERAEAEREAFARARASRPPLVEPPPNIRIGIAPDTSNAYGSGVYRSLYWGPYGYGWRPHHHGWHHHGWHWRPAPSQPTLSLSGSSTWSSGSVTWRLNW